MFSMLQPTLQLNFSLANDCPTYFNFPLQAIWKNDKSFNFQSWNLLMNLNDIQCYFGPKPIDDEPINGASHPRIWGRCNYFDCSEVDTSAPLGSFG